MIRPALLVPACLLLVGSPGSAARAEGEVAPAPDTCAGRSALYESPKGGKLWIVRRGSMLMGENPLRPLSRDRALVLEVVVNGRLATAWGPDASALRQGGAARDIERLGVEPIRWDGAPRSGSAEALTLVADDGTVVSGPLRFSECQDTPKATPVAARADKPARGRTKGAPAGRLPGDAVEPQREPAWMPKGALPSLQLPGR